MLFAPTLEETQEPEWIKTTFPETVSGLVSPSPNSRCEVTSWVGLIAWQQLSWGQQGEEMIYKKTIPWIREWKALIHSKSSRWQTLILWTFCAWTKAPTFLNYMVWVEACFQGLPNRITAINFPNCSCQNFLDLCSVLHLQGHLVNVWHCQAAFHAMRLSFSFFPAYGDPPNTRLLKISWIRSKYQSIIIVWSALRQIIYCDNEPLIFSVLRVMGLLLFEGLCILWFTGSPPGNSTRKMMPDL